MSKLCINTRDELVVISLDRIAYIKAEGNYAKITYIGGMQLLVSLGIGKLEELIRKSCNLGEKSSFVRIGRSYLINQVFVQSISIPNEILVLSDFRKAKHTLRISKPLLKIYKDLFKKK